VLDAAEGCVPMLDEERAHAIESMVHEDLIFPMAR
jgi:hypothetical protein